MHMPDAVRADGNLHYNSASGLSRCEDRQAQRREEDTYADKTFHSRNRQRTQDFSRRRNCP
jgi:hypothetical protein